jgi:hypothetical protein
MFSRRRFSRGKETNGKKKLGFISVLIRFLLPKLLIFLVREGLEVSVANSK